MKNLLQPTSSKYNQTIQDRKDTTMWCRFYKFVMSIRYSKDSHSSSARDFKFAKQHSVSKTFRGSVKFFIFNSKVLVFFSNKVIPVLTRDLASRS
ncbi:hypothetical protein RchiOBHm_Chr1g0341381 [Rosa chinensis]|uniref:Uncharacterized protein n=1 Tax=Rosa chinensis TaxID=74649 RepID=A0A2P6SDQ9_ROSCH|nr:hypothetical protein RchiOBHm_Chr1g0341381 [Rosa chinensis]